MTTPTAATLLETMNAGALLDLLGNPFMVATPDGIITYANEPAYQMFEVIESDIRKDLPNFFARNVVGKSVDEFHKNPSYQHGIMRRMKGVHDGAFSIGGRHLKFRATPRFDAQGAKNAIIVEWFDVTEITRTRVELEALIRDMTEMAKAHELGDIDMFLDPAAYGGELGKAAIQLNEMVRGHIETKKRAIEVISAFGRGEFDTPMPKLPRKKAFVSDAIETVRGQLLGITDEVARLSRAIVEGRLDLEPEVDRYAGAFRSIIETFVEAYESLNATFNDIRTQLDQVGQAAEETTRASQLLATNAAISSSSVDEVSTSTEETDQMVQTNATAAANTSDIVAGAAREAMQGREKIGQMVGAMEDIRNSSADIGKIIKVIDEIAFQTNLLALNAAVEAARAGQHGRGFAVVAHEVRNLAGRSAKAARETSDLIESATARVTSGVQIAHDTRDSFERIGDDILKVQSLVGEIARASNEQSRGVAQINLAIGEVAKTAIATSQQAEELAAGADQMLASARQMRESISRFRLRAVKPRAMAMDGMPPDMMAQFQRFLAMQGLQEPTVPANTDMQLSANSRAYGTARARNDHDKRGFQGF